MYVAPLSGPAVFAVALVVGAFLFNDVTANAFVLARFVVAFDLDVAVLARVPCVLLVAGAAVVRVVVVRAAHTGFARFALGVGNAARVDWHARVDYLAEVAQTALGAVAVKRVWCRML